MGGGRQLDAMGSFGALAGPYDRCACCCMQDGVRIATGNCYLLMCRNAQWGNAASATRQAQTMPGLKIDDPGKQTGMKGGVVMVHVLLSGVAAGDMFSRQPRWVACYMEETGHQFAGACRCKALRVPQLD